MIRKFDCIVVTQFPLAFSMAWKNEINTLFTEDISNNGNSNSHDNGRPLHNWGTV